MITSICICGAGTMGSGIAQLCAQHGFNTILYDVNALTLAKARTDIMNSLQHLVDKQKISPVEKEEICRRATYVGNISDCTADLVIEAVVENIEVKSELLNQLAQINQAGVILATNTSSLSVSNIQKNVDCPERVIGMHFFNPATLMKLVEVVKGTLTNDSTLQTVSDLCRKMDKMPVVCKDAPGFIVNRVARHYYLEAMKMVENGIGSFKDVDAVMEATGFKMGPFKLIDLIGMDVNLAVSQSLYKSFDSAERFKPSSIQVEKVKQGFLGVKTQRGFYEYK